MSESELFAAPADLTEAAVTAERGHNVVIAMPPGAAGATPILAALARRLAAAPAPGLRALLLTTSDTATDWAEAATRAMPGCRVVVAGTPARTVRHLRAGQAQVLIATPAQARQLLEQSAMKPDQLAAVVLAWPEAWGGAEALAVLMHDLDKDAQRIVCTALPERAADVIERYARKSLTVGFPPAEAPPASPVGPVRTVSVAWSRRASAVAEVAELLDPARVSIWCLDGAGVSAVKLALAGHDLDAVVTDGAVDTSDLVIAFDLPTPSQLRTLLAAGPVVLLVPPAAEEYVARVASPRRSLRLSGAVDAAQDEAARRRGAIAQVLEAGVPGAGLLALAPLFERHDPSAVAAATYQLWTGAPGAPVSAAVPAQPMAAPAAPEAVPGGTTARMFVSVGRQDGTTASDLVAVLTKEVRVDKSMIGRIELKEAYSLVELPAGEVERIVRGMDGRTVRNKKIMCKVDRGPASPAPKRRAPTSGGSRAP
ncbi:MAG TPA: DbpA RNA binding domain-containing protein [Gemmatimonadales bacterium]|nr:DbpA RNA binding domain-containing protein [Gemmatimonadales bacterium]